VRSRPTSRAIRDDPGIAVVAEVMGGLQPAGDHVLRAGNRSPPPTNSSSPPAARTLRGGAAERGVQLRFEASVCAAIPVVRSQALVVSNIHRVLGT
jgi:homoserine dehydrogenase